TLKPDKETLTENITSLAGEKQATWIGISPFAQHLQKVYPLNKMENVIQHFSDYKIFIFGGGDEEKSIAEAWQNKYQNVTSTIGKFSIREELKLISNLDVMISMDSS